MSILEPLTTRSFTPEEHAYLRRLNPDFARDRIRAIASDASTATGIKTATIMGAVRYARVVRARDMVIYKAASEGFIDEVIANALGMDRSSVWAARQRESKRRGEA